MEQYGNFAYIYDQLMDDVDYNLWVDYIEKIIEKENVDVKNILELACGTGNLTLPLAKKEYDIAGIDISEEMLEVAREKSIKKNIPLVLLQQDVSKLDFDLYGLDCVLCGCDGFNYIIDEKGLQNTFNKTHELLKENGIFIFDVSSYYKIKNILGNNVFAENREKIAYMWKNYFDEETSLIEMELSFFVSISDEFDDDSENVFERYNEKHYQRAYKNEEILSMLKSSGFENIKIYGDFKFEEPKEDSERVFFIAVK